MLEKVGKVRIYQVDKGIGWITFEDGSGDLPIYYHVLKKNGLEILRVNQKVLVSLEKKGSHTEIIAIEKLDN